MATHDAATDWYTAIGWTIISTKPPCSTWGYSSTRPKEQWPDLVFHIQCLQDTAGRLIVNIQDEEPDDELKHIARICGVTPGINRERYVCSPA